MTDKLSLYNGALFKLGSPPISALTDNDAARKAIDAIYSSAVDFCLEMANWTFALRTVKIDASTDVEPGFGYNFAFEKPDDFVRLSAMSGSAELNPPLEDYDEDQDYWYADVDPIYLKFVSSGASYGYDLGAWPEAFADMVEYRLAIKAGPQIKQNISNMEDLKRDFRTARGHAIGLYGTQLPARRFPNGSWTRSRHGRSGGDRSRDRY